jgi:SAM-dependent methyltransferase
MAWTSSSSKNKLSTTDRSALARLTSVRQQRAPFESLSRQLIARTLERYLPDGPIAEIGMGDGQLYTRLPADLLPRITHTEPLAAASKAFRKDHPNLTVLQAGAEKLPFADGELAAVIGLCVMDVVPDGTAVARELRRVLRPGGRFLHWLDMSTVLTPIVASVAETELLLLPNVFGDPSEGEWPEDLFVVPRRQLALIVAILQQAGHGLARPLGQYLQVFSASPLAVKSAAAELAQLQDSSALRSALKEVFRAAFELADPALRQELASFQGQPVSSSRHFEQRLRAWFAPEAGFQVEASEVVRAWELAPRAATDSAYASLCIGEQRYLPYAPERPLCADASLPDDTQTLRELGIFSFVASRI